MNMVPMFPLKLSMKPQQTHKNCPFPEHPFSDVVVFFAKAVCFFGGSWKMKSPRWSLWPPCERSGCWEAHKNGTSLMVGWCFMDGLIFMIYIYMFIVIYTPTNRECSHKSLRNCANYPWHKLPDKRDVNRIASSPGFHPQFVSKASW